MDQALSVPTSPDNVVYQSIFLTKIVLSEDDVWLQLLTRVFKPQAIEIWAHTGLSIDLSSQALLLKPDLC